MTQRAEYGLGASDVRAIAAELFSRGKTRDEVSKMLIDLRLVALALGRPKSAKALESVAAEIVLRPNQS